MWKLPLPHVDSVEDELTRGLTDSDGNQAFALTAPIWADISANYNSYDAQSGRAHPALRLLALGNDKLSAIRDCYDQVQDKKRLSDLRDRLMSQANECPWCSENSVNELDHYIPKQKFKALAIYPRNLIPICGRCNKHKLEHLSEEDADRLVHAYLEPLPAQPFLRANVTFITPALDIVYDIDPVVVTADTLARLTFQLERLHLNDRWRARQTNYLFNHKVSLEQAYGPAQSADNIKAYLAKVADDHSSRFGVNDWRSALLRGLSTHDDFCGGGFSDYYAHAAAIPV